MFYCCSSRLGLVMYGLKHTLEHDVFQIQGNILLGVTGVILTIPELWIVVVSAQSTRLISLLFALAFVTLLFVLIRKGSLISLLFVCVTIFRYYTDTFAFLPKSLFFIVGGLLLLGFGFYFERMNENIQRGAIGVTKQKTFILAVVIPLLILLAMTIKPQTTVLFGQEIVLETKAFDPTDLFRGDYVAISVAISEIPKSKVTLPIDKVLSKNLYVSLKQEGKYYVVDQVSEIKPKQGVYLRGKLSRNIQ